VVIPFFLINTVCFNFIKMRLNLIREGVIKIKQLKKLFNNIKIWPLLVYNYIIKVFNHEFLYNIKVAKLLGPSLNIYYPVKSSIFSITLRITGVFIVLIFFGLFFFYLFFVFFILIYF